MVFRLMVFRIERRRFLFRGVLCSSRHNRPGGGGGRGVSCFCEKNKRMRGVEGPVKIESFWTVAKRGNESPASSRSQVSESRPGAPGYYDFNVWNPEKTTEKLRYMHRNPVVRGLVAKPEDWPWSSFRHYATGMEGTIEIESFWTAAKRGNELPAFI